MRPSKKFNPVPFAYHEEVTLEITTLTNMGQGLGRVDGWVVMVAFALPGEKVRVRIYRNDKNFSEGDLIEVLEPSLFLGADAGAPGRFAAALAALGRR